MSDDDLLKLVIDDIWARRKREWATEGDAEARRQAMSFSIAAFVILV